MATVSVNGLLAPLVIGLTAASFVFQSAFADDISSSGQWKTTAQTGQVVIQPRFEFCDAFRKGFARVMYSGKLGVIDSQARYVVEPIYDDVKDINDAVVPVHIGGEKGKWGILSVTDNPFTVNPSFDDVIGPLNGAYSLVNRAENTMTYVDRNGVKLDASAFKVVRHDYNVTFNINNYKFGITNANVEYIVEPIFEQRSGQFGVEHLVPACEKNCFSGQDGLWGFIDQRGVFRIHAQFGDAFTFSEGLAAVRIGDERSGKWGYIGVTGRFQINPTFDEAAEFSEGLAWVRIDQKGGFIDRSGNFVIDPLDVRPP